MIETYHCWHCSKDMKVLSRTTPDLRYYILHLECGHKIYVDTTKKWVGLKQTFSFSILG